MIFSSRHSFLNLGHHFLTLRYKWCNLLPPNSFFNFLKFENKKKFISNLKKRNIYYYQNNISVLFYYKKLLVKCVEKNIIT